MRVARTQHLPILQPDQTGFRDILGPAGEGGAAAWRPGLGLWPRTHAGELGRPWKAPPPCGFLWGKEESQAPTPTGLGAPPAPPGHLALGATRRPAE